VTGHALRDLDPAARPALPGVRRLLHHRNEEVRTRAADVLKALDPVQR
jgi:hypothetical protein